MGQRTSETSLSDSIDEFFEPAMDAMEDEPEDDTPATNGKNRLAQLRRRAEQRLEEKRMREELDYLDLDWDDE
ncbi:MAG: hypothetical protein QNI86_02680 [Halieaceae bacterium]|nr:hypothetical protein [Halieaceae bacterium]